MPTCAVQCLPVRSSWINQIILTANCTLAVWYKNGFCCEYPRTTKAWFQQMLVSPSKGHFVRQFLYKRMPYKAIRPPCPPNGFPTACCPAKQFPSTIHATLANIHDAACASGTIPLVYDSGTQKWTGTGAIGTCGHNITLKWYCGVGGTLATDMLLDIAFPDGCGLDRNAVLPTSAACDPIDFVYQSGLAVPCGGDPGGTMSITVTT